MGLLSLLSSSLQFNGIHSALDVDGTSEERLRWPSRAVVSLGDALACVPSDSGLSPTVAFRVVVLGKERELRAELSESLYRIGREAIMNAYRHSGAARIEVEIEYRRGGLRVAVRDDGCGIDP
jgi:signal transduction histidine kinase